MFMIVAKSQYGYSTAQFFKTGDEYELDIFTEHLDSEVFKSDKHTPIEHSKEKTFNDALAKFYTYWSFDYPQSEDKPNVIQINSVSEIPDYDFKDLEPVVFEFEGVGYDGESI